LKKWTLSVVGNEPSLIHNFAERDCEVFYYGTDGARNHPDNPPDTPNWFYYWNQSSHAQLSIGVNFDWDTAAKNANAYTWWNSAHGAWEAYIGPTCGGPDATRSITLGTNQGMNYTGIDVFMRVLRHELAHNVKYCVWYPNGPDDISGNDTDTDWLRDDAESAAGGTAGNPINGGPFYTPGNAPAGVNPQDSNAPVGDRDGEDYVLHLEGAWSDTAGTADADDWAREGRNWNR
jgi:hypothetical protein